MTILSLNRPLGLQKIYCVQAGMWFIKLKNLSVIFSEIFQAIYKQIAIRITELKFCEQLRTHKSYCSTVHFRRITSMYQPTNAHIYVHSLVDKLK